mmetsp:Transcript_15005/g.16985  ORF Transcript_15005/g.16985 Transcript_15005/m.16985 type:complete len:150 (+) Transcript_15005:3-452(+)
MNRLSTAFGNRNRNQGDMHRPGAFARASAMFGFNRQQGYPNQPNVAYPHQPREPFFQRVSAFFGFRRQDMPIQMNGSPHNLSPSPIAGLPPSPYSPHQGSRMAPSPMSGYAQSSGSRNPPSPMNGYYSPQESNYGSNYNNGSRYNDRRY